MYKVVLVDDEKNCLEVLEILLKQNHPEFVVVGSFTSPIDALEFLKKETIDLLFLDIQMPHMSGIDVIISLGELAFSVIFTTAFDQYALNAIKLSALDYLLKPIDEDLLAEGVQKFIKFKKSKNEINEQIINLLHTIDKKNNNDFQKIAVPLADKIYFYNIQDIVHLESNDNYTYIFFVHGEKLLTSKSIKHYEEILLQHNFLRCHQSYIINSRHILNYIKKDGGSITMSNNAEIPVSRNKRESMIAFFKNL